jgi:Zinc knuckle
MSQASARQSRRTAGLKAELSEGLPPPTRVSKLKSQEPEEKGPPSSPLSDPDSFLSILKEEEDHDVDKASPATLVPTQQKEPEATMSQQQQSVGQASGNNDDLHRLILQMNERLTTIADNHAAVNERIQQLEADQRREREGSRARSQRGQSRIREHNSDEEDDHADDQRRRRNREATPHDSAWGNGRFRPTGLAAKEIFQPYGNDKQAMNPEYDAKARERGSVVVFEGGKDEFRDWVIKFQDRLLRNRKTFESEADRMAFLIEHLKGTPLGMLRSRYDSDKHPYSSLAEMMQVLATVYLSPNLASEARTKLQSMKYDGFSKQDIEEFISQVNGLFDLANVQLSERKLQLWEHVTSELGNDLYAKALDDDTSYESFTMAIARAAHNLKRTREERALRRSTRSTTTIPKHQSSRNWRPPSTTEAKPTTSLDAKRSLTQPEQKDHAVAGTCFSCGKKGHMSRDCPSKGKGVRAAAEEQGEGNNDINHESSSDGSRASSSESEN